MLPDASSLALLTLIASGFSLPGIVSLRLAVPHLAARWRAARADRALAVLISALAGAGDENTHRRLLGDAAAGAGIPPADLAALIDAAKSTARRTPPASLEPAALVAQALRRAVDGGGEDGPTARLRCGHTRKLYGDEGRLTKTLGSILARGAAVAGADGKLWIETRDVERNDIPYVAVIIGCGAGAGAVPAPLVGGIGFALLRRIAAAHWGRVEIHEVAGGGTEVVLTLPAAMSPSRLKPQCAKASLGCVAAALGGATAPAWANAARFSLA
jgi:hypothetical protein